MATIEQQKELIEVLKFTPRTYKIELGAYGGEAYFGKVSRETYDFFKEHKIDLDEYATDWDDEKWSFIPDELRPFPPGSPFECDNLCHASGPSLDSGNYLTVYDENGTEVFQCELDSGPLEDQGIEVDCWEEEYVDHQPDGTVVFWGGQGEKGLCFGGELELKAPFDPAKLKIKYSDCDGWCIVNGVEYDGEDIDNYDYSTTGKWGENKWIIVGSDEEIYEGVNREDMGNEDSDLESESNVEADYECVQCEWKGTVDQCSYNDNDEMICPDCGEPVEKIKQDTSSFVFTEWFTADVKPAYKGEYEVSLDAEWPLGGIIRAMWTGRTWKDEDGSKVKIKGWRGLAEDPNK